MSMFTTCVPRSTINYLISQPQVTEAIHTAEDLVPMAVKRFTLNFEIVAEIAARDLTLGAPALHTVHKPLLPQPILVDISFNASTTLVDYSYTS